jgi:hypothetical protein
MNKKLNLPGALTLMLLLMIFSLPVSGQQQCERIIFSYDNAGNRIKRELNTDCPPALIKEKNPMDVTLDPNPAGNFLHVYVRETENASESLKEQGEADPINENVNAPEKVFSEGRLSLINHSGHTVMQQTIYSPDVTLDVSSLSNGIYYCRVVFEDGRQATKRVIVLK